MNNIFKGLKIIELSSVLAGPAVGMFFAELGATVIKVENSKTNGDVTRTWHLPTENPENVSAYYASVNFNKKVIYLDLSSKKGRKSVYNLIEDADIIITNYKKGAAEKLKMDYPRLSAIKPDLIYAHLTGFGLNSDRPAFDVVLQAEAGFMFMCGEKAGMPVKMPVALIDILAAHHLKEGILVGLIERLKTGKGSFITTSLYEAAIASLANQAANWLMAGHVPQRMGSQHPNIAPYGDVFHTKDDKAVVIACGTQRHFVLLCRYFGIENLCSDERFISNKNRVANRKELNAILDLHFQKKDRDELINELTELQVPIGAIRNMQEVFDNPACQSLILEEALDETHTRRVKTAIFELNHPPE